MFRGLRPTGPKHLRRAMTLLTPGPAVMCSLTYRRSRRHPWMVRRCFAANDPLAIRLRPHRFWTARTIVRAMDRLGCRRLIFGFRAWGPMSSSPPRSLRPAPRRCPTSNPSCASMDVFSAWRLLPDLHVGIVHVKTDRSLSTCWHCCRAWRPIGLVSARASTICAKPRKRCGMHGWRCAVAESRGSVSRCSTARSSLPPPSSAPEVMVKLVTPTIDCFAELADNERGVLFDTVRV